MNRITPAITFFSFIDFSLDFTVLHYADKYKPIENKKAVCQSMFEKIKGRQMRNIDFPEIYILERFVTLDVQTE